MSLVRVWYKGIPPFCQICKISGHKAVDCQFNGKCRKCGSPDHKAHACTRPWGQSAVPMEVAVPVVPDPPETVVPAVSVAVAEENAAEADVPVISETSSMVSSGPPSVSDVTPGTSGGSLLDALGSSVSVIESMVNESVNNETVVNESNIEENVVNEINGTNLVNDIESNDSQASGSMECSSSPCISSFSSPSGPPDSLDLLLAAGLKRSKRTIVPSVAVTAASIVKRSKAVAGARVQKKKSK